MASVHPSCCRCAGDDAVRVGVTGADGQRRTSNLMCVLLTLIHP